MNKILMTVMTVFTMLMGVACGGPRYVDYFPYHDDGMPKPRVAVIPLSDNTECGLGWNFTDEVTQGLYYELMNSGQLYVLSPEEIGPAWTNRDQYDFFGTNCAYVKDFCGTDFVAAIELIDHSVVPFDPCTGTELVNGNIKVCTKAILMRVRIKVVDIRCQTPRVVLFEITKCLYPLNPGTPTDCVGNIAWGCPGYTKSICGMAHQRMICQIALRLEEVTRIAR
jgi:hypothetical protein